MSTVGRNEPCGCGSGRKSKHCCGVLRGPGEADLARAFLASHVRPAARALRGCTDEEFDDLEVEMLELPTVDRSLQLALPRLVTPDIDRLLVAIDEGELDEIDDALPAVLARVDTPTARAGLARAVLALRDQGRVGARVAALALLELSDPAQVALVSSAVVQAAAVVQGGVATPSGLLVAR